MRATDWWHGSGRFAVSPPRAIDRAATRASRNQNRIQALEARVAHLERLLEGLQDSVHRESERHARLIAGLQTQVQPEAMGAALAENTRDRGL